MIKEETIVKLLNDPKLITREHILRADSYDKIRLNNARATWLSCERINSRKKNDSYFGKRDTKVKIAAGICSTNNCLNPVYPGYRSCKKHKEYWAERHK